MHLLPAHSISNITVLSSTCMAKEKWQIGLDRVLPYMPWASASYLPEVPVPQFKDLEPTPWLLKEVTGFYQLIGLRIFCVRSVCSWNPESLTESSRDWSKNSVTFIFKTWTHVKHNCTSSNISPNFPSCALGLYITTPCSLLLSSICDFSGSISNLSVIRGLKGFLSIFSVFQLRCSWSQKSWVIPRIIYAKDTQALIST